MGAPGQQHRHLVGPLGVENIPGRAGVGFLSRGEKEGIEAKAGAEGTRDNWGPEETSLGRA